MSWFALREYSSGHIAYVCKITHTSLRAACDVIFNGAIHHDTNVLLRETRGIRYVISYRISNRHHTHRNRLSPTDTFFMMTSSNENIFRVTGHLCGEFTRGEFTGPRLIAPHKGQWCGALVFSLICARTKGWVNNGEAGDLRRHPAHYDVIVMLQALWFLTSWDVSFF